MSVAERIAKLQKANGSNDAGDTNQPGVVKGASGAKVSALSNDLSSKLNMKAMIGGPPPARQKSGGVSGPPDTTIVRAAMHTCSHVETGSAEDGKLKHIPRTIMPPGSRRRRTTKGLY